MSFCIFLPFLLGLVGGNLYTVDMFRREDFSALLTRIFGGGVVGVALVVLMGWVFKIQLLTQLLVDSLPMAPGSALFALVFGLALTKVTKVQGERWAWGLFTVGWVGLLCTGFSFLGLQGVFERWGVSIPHSQGVLATLGQQSPGSAFCFFLVSLGFFISNWGRTSPGQSWRSKGVAALCLSLFLVAAMLHLIYWMGVSCIFEGSLYLIPYPTVLVILGLSLGLCAREWPIIAGPRAFDLYPISAGSILILLTVSGLGLGAYLFMLYANHYRARAERELSSVAQLKEVEMVSWRNECLQDGYILRNNRVFVNFVERYFSPPLSSERVEAGRSLAEWLKRYPLDYQYDQVLLLDHHGATRMGFLRQGDRVEVSSLLPLSSLIQDEIRGAVQDKKLRLVDLPSARPDQPIYLMVVIPLISASPGGSVVGVVCLWINPEIYLTPLISWSNSSGSKWTSLLQYDHLRDPFFIHQVNLRADGGVRSHISTGKKDLVSVMAASGVTGIVAGFGAGFSSVPVPVIADIRKIPDSLWYVVTQSTLVEVYTPLKLHIWGTVGLMMTLIVGVGMTLFAISTESREAGLRESEGFLKETQLVARLGTFEVNLSPQFESSNQVNLFRPSLIYYEMMGLDSSLPLTIKNLQDLVYPEDLRALSQYIQRLLSEQASKFDQTYRILRSKDGELRWVHSVGRIDYDHHGQPSRIIGTTQDVTESKCLALELLAAKEAAEAAAESKARFLDIAAHELRNPVTALSLLCELAERRVLKGQLINTELMARIQEPLKRLSYLVVNLLEFSKLERGKISIDLQRVDLVKLASRCISEFQLRCENPRISLLTHESAIYVDLDPVRINQVISNLIENALKYTTPSVLIEVKLDLISEAVRVSVVDHGLGIDQEKLDRIFSSIDLHTNKNLASSEGVGLGLSICRGIIELHGGSFQIQSKLGSGSNFFFELPSVRSTV